MEESSFAKLIRAVPQDAKVLDVGCGGLHGENTTTYLAEYFKPENITGICYTDKEVEIFHAQRKDKRLPPIKVISDDFYKHKFDEKFDLVVLDLNIENNLKDWSYEQLDKMCDLVKDGGFLINYIMMTDQYGDEDTGVKIRQHLKEFWGTDKFDDGSIGERLRYLLKWELWANVQEERRNYIQWILLRKK